MQDSSHSGGAVLANSSHVMTQLFLPKAKLVLQQFSQLQVY
jgi:hypothetical protein